MLRRCCLVASLVIGYLLIVAGPAAACPPGSTPSPTGGGICIPVTDPGTPSGLPHDGQSNPGSTGCLRDDGTPVECVTEWGVWDSTHQCWIHPVNVPPSDPVWDGHTDGSIWMCALIVDGVDPLVVFWLPPGAAPGGLPDPGRMAQHALGILPLETAEVHTAPQDPDGTIVGVENWLWVPKSQWRTLTKTVTAGGTSVTVAAKPDRVLWDMGPETKTCYDPGAEWKPGMTDAATTSCGYSYRVTSHSEPDGAFQLAARIEYQVDWICSGACTSGSGTLGLVDAPAGTGRLRVLQRQTVVVQ